MYIKIIDEGFVYENPFPQLRCRNAFFPEAVELPDSRWMVSHTLGEAMESIDSTTVISVSNDKGKTWELLKPIYNKSNQPVRTSDVMKISPVGEKELIAFGFEYFRKDEDSLINNPKTSGGAPNRIVYHRSFDLGESWQGPFFINRSFPSPVEAMSSIVVLNDGTWIAPIANFLDWDGNCPEGLQGRIVRSEDRGLTWDDTTVTMKFSEPNIAVWEQRCCQLDDGTVALIAWVEHLQKGGLPIHIVFSKDNARSFGPPISTGVMAQASFITKLSGTKVLTLHCMRANTDRPGIYANIVDLKNDSWNLLHSQIIWEPPYLIRDNKVSKAFAYLKFGQPSAIRLSDGDFLMVNWIMEEGIGKCVWRRLRIEE